MRSAAVLTADGVEFMVIEREWTSTPKNEMVNLAAASDWGGDCGRPDCREG